MLLSKVWSDLVGGGERLLVKMLMMVMMLDSYGMCCPFYIRGFAA